MKLHDHMEEAVGGSSTDLVRLARASQQQGTRLRRNRLARNAVGVAAAAAVIFSAVQLTAGTSTLDPDTAREVPAGVAAAPTPSADPSAGPPSSPSADKVVLTGRGTAAALRAAIEEQATGTFGGFAGQGDALGQGSDDTYGRLEFTPSDGTGVGVVGVNVQDGSILDQSRFDCAETFMVDCSVETLANGDRIRTYWGQPVATDEGPGLRVTAELLTDDRSLRVIASASNGFDLGGNRFDVTRRQPVLTAADLSRIVSQPWWGFRVPSEFQQAGEELSPYTDLDANVS
ncbi:MAG: hypothetical protein WB471_13480 [Nocardioides sp.]